MLQSNCMPSQTGNREKLAGARVSAVRLRRLLDLLSGAAPGRHERVGGERVGTERTKARFEDSSSLYLAPGDTPDPAALAATGWDRPLAELGDTALGDGCGLVGIRCGDQGLLVSPPYPVKETYLSTDWDDELLREILNGDYTVGVVLVRLGRFSVAVFRGGELVEAKTDSGTSRGGTTRAERRSCGTRGYAKGKFEGCTARFARRCGRGSCRPACGWTTWPWAASGSR